MRNSRFLVTTLSLGITDKAKIYTCTVAGCGYSTMRVSHFRRHQRIHTNEKPYFCKYCSYQASRSDHLKRHERIHERSFARKAIIKKKKPMEEISKQVMILPKAAAPFRKEVNVDLNEGGTFLLFVYILVTIFLSFIHRCYCTCAQCKNSL